MKQVAAIWLPSGIVASARLLRRLLRLTSLTDGRVHVGGATSAEKNKVISLRRIAETMFRIASLSMHVGRVNLNPSCVFTLGTRY